MEKLRAPSPPSYFQQLSFALKYEYLLSLYVLFIFTMTLPIKKITPMSPEGTSKTFYALSLAWQLGFFIAIPIGGFLFLGLLVDRFLDTEPFLLLLGLLVGIVITIYEVYHLLMPLINKSEEQKQND